MFSLSLLTSFNIFRGNDNVEKRKLLKLAGPEVYYAPVAKIATDANFRFFITTSAESRWTLF